MNRLAIVVSHPIQYYSPWFSFLAAQTDIELKVFYLWDFGSSESLDRGFNERFAWDRDLLSGYDYEFVENVSSHPGTDSFFGLRNPELIEKVELYSPTAVLVFGYKYYSLLRLLYSSRLKKIPILFRGDSHVLAEDTNILKSIILNMIFKSFQAFLSVGVANREYFRKFGVVENKIFHVPHAIDLEFYQKSIIEKKRDVRKELSIEPDDILLLFAGKFSNKKQVLELLHVFARLENKNVSLLFCGGGILEAELKNKAKKLDKVFFLPFQNQSQMPCVYNQSDLLVLPSYGNYETWGMAVHEAFAVATPALVSSHVGSRQDLIIEGETGFAFEAGSQIDFLSVLTQAVESRGTLHAMGQKAQKHIEQYSYPEGAKGLLTVLESL